MANTGSPAPPSGLTDAEVQRRTAEGHTNQVSPHPGRTFGEIVAANVFTPVNAIMIVLLGLVTISGNYRDGLFGGVVASNAVIGIVQESRARRELRRLRVLTDPTAEVIRDGTRTTVPIDQLVLGDVVFLHPGAQLPFDGRAMVSDGLQLDESMLTGESESVGKQVDDAVMSGSFVVAGTGYIEAESVGDDSYAGRLTSEAQVFSTAQSQLRGGVNRILRWLIVIIPLASVFLFISLLNSEPRWQNALQGTVAAAVAMVPDGLVLLTSVAFVAGMFELSRRGALAKHLTTVELLAQVDTVCLDKTGTLTTGTIEFAAIHPLGGHTDHDVRCALATLVGAEQEPNATTAAISAAVDEDRAWEFLAVEPFSSARKWAAVSTVDHGWLYLGGADVVLPEPGRSDLVDRLSRRGQRVVAVSTSTDGPHGDSVPEDLTPMGIVELRDEVRSDAFSTLAYFAAEGVDVKIISGDSAPTVGAIAERAGLQFKGAPVDARDLPEDLSELGEALDRSDVFGRVAPHQKQAMVHALQQRGHVVAMTGDGVNDVLALKDADLGIAMGSGSDAARSVADLVLTDDQFATLPVVVDEGRKVINNVERVANLFVTKAVYAVLLTLAVGAIDSPFPFLPRQLTLIGTFSIGVPGFFLALAPEAKRVRDGFLRPVLRFSIPAGIIAGAITLVAYEVARRRTGVTLAEARTLATITLLGIGLAVLLVASSPLRAWKVGLAAAMAGSYAGLLAIPWARDFFALELFSGSAWVIVAVATLVAGSAIAAIPVVERALHSR